MKERLGRVREAVLVVCVTMFCVTQLPLIHTYIPFFLFSLTKRCLTFLIPHRLFLSSSFYFLSLCPSPVSHLLPPISSSYLSFCCLFLSFRILRFILAFSFLLILLSSPFVLIFSVFYSRLCLRLCPLVFISSTFSPSCPVYFIYFPSNMFNSSQPEL